MKNNYIYVFITPENNGTIKKWAVIDDYKKAVAFLDYVKTLKDYTDFRILEFYKKDFNNNPILSQLYNVTGALTL